MVKSRGKLNTARKIPDIDLTGIKLPVMKVFHPFRIRPLPGQPRQRFFGIKELADSIQVMDRQLLPIIVREINDDPNYEAELIDGERRLEACKYLRRGIIAYLWDGKTDPEDIYAASVAANHGQQKHDAVELLASIARFRKNKRSYKEIAAIFGKTISWVTQRYMIRKLHGTVQKWLIPVVTDVVAGNGHVKGKTPIDVATMKSQGSRKIKPPLSFQLAIPLTKVPMDQQVALGREIIQQKMSLAQAQRYINSKLRGMGIKAKSRSPGEQRQTLLSVTDRVGHMLGSYADMSYTELHAIMSNMSEGELRRLDRHLDVIAEAAITLRQDVVRVLSGPPPTEVQQAILAETNGSPS